MVAAVAGAVVAAAAVGGDGAAGELVGVAIVEKPKRPSSRLGCNLRLCVGLPATAAGIDCWLTRHCSSWLQLRPRPPAGLLGGGCCCCWCLCVGGWYCWCCY